MCFEVVPSKHVIEFRALGVGRCRAQTGQLHQPSMNVLCIVQIATLGPKNEGLVKLSVGELSKIEVV